MHEEGGGRCMGALARRRAASCSPLTLLLLLILSLAWCLASQTGSVLGPSGTPYEGGTFLVDIVIPANYPFEPPKMRFDTRLWHPNVSSQNGAICLDILKTEWSAARRQQRGEQLEAQRMTHSLISSMPSLQMAI